MTETCADIVDLCDTLRAMIQSAPPAKRAAFLEAFDQYAARYPELWPLLQSPQTPSFFYHFVGDVYAACRALASVNRPKIRGETLRVFH